MPNLSITVPVFNVSNHIVRCVEGILSQSYSDFECFLVDDGASDESAHLCDIYASLDARFVVLHRLNGGVSQARNAGIDVSAGDYITFCDGDDYYTNDWLQNLMEAAISNNCDFVTSGYLHVNENEEELQEFNRKVGSWSLDNLEERYRYLIENVLYGGNGWEVWSSVFRRTVVMEYDLRFCETCADYAEDLSFVLSFALFAERFTAIPGNGYSYVKRSGSMMDRSAKKIKLNSLNEVSKFFWKYYCQVFKDSNREARYQIVHFYVLYVEVHKLLDSGEFGKVATLPEEYSKIVDQKWNMRYSSTMNSENARLAIDSEYMVSKRIIWYYLKRILLRLSSLRDKIIMS